MYLVFLIIWIIFNEKFNLEILLFGLVISAAVFAFVCRFMDYSVKKELHFYRKLPGMMRYVFVLVKEILVANLNVCHLILSEEEEIDPALAQFRADMETPAGRAFYANAITEQFINSRPSLASAPEQMSLRTLRSLWKRP